MKKLLKTLLNNGFFVLALLIAVTLYLAYGQKQAAQNKAYVSPHQESADIAANASSSDDAPLAPAEDTASEAASEEKTTAAAEDMPAAPAAPESKTAAPATTANTPATAESTAPEQTAPSEKPAAQTAAETDTAASGAEMLAATPEQAAADTDQTSAVAAQHAAEHATQGDRNDEQKDAADTASSKAESENTPVSANAPDTPSDTPAATTQETSTQLNDGTTEVRVQTATTESNGQRHSEVRVQVNQPPTQSDEDKAAAGYFDPRQINDRAILSYFSGPREALAAAREAAQKGDYVWSAAIYSSLLKHYPRADLAGELGNVLWRMGEKQWAHRAWRYAAQLLIREGRIDIARTFARNIAKVDPALSREIEAHLPPVPSDRNAPAAEKK